MAPIQLGALLGLLLLTQCRAAPVRPTGELQATSPDGVTIAYTAAGQGEPALLFIHGGFANRRFWKVTVPALAGEHHVVALDLAGHGDSGAAREEWTIAAFADDVRAVMDAQRLEQVVLVGNSLGGAVALEVARGDPRVVAVIGAESLHDASRTQDPARWEAVAQDLEQDPDGTIRGMVDGLLPADVDPGLKSWVTRQMQSASATMGPALMRHLASYDMAATMAQVTVPIRCVNGDLYPTHSTANRRLSPGFEVMVLEGVGHYPMLEAPGVFARALRETLRGLDRPRR